MFAKATLGLAVILATASGALAAMKTHSAAAYAAYNQARAYEDGQIRLDDCVHVTFPQCDGNAAQTHR
jgi:hypothetical protein